MLSTVRIGSVSAAGPGLTTYTLDAVPSIAQEGSTITLVLTVSGLVTGGTSVTYQFRFNVVDPGGKTTSVTRSHTTTPTETGFTILVDYPSTGFPGSNSLVGKYTCSVDQLMPTAMTGVASSSFALKITDSSSYERTQTVNVHATGYNASESVTVTIKTQTTSTTVNTQIVPASITGVVAATWKIPVNATIDNYVVTLTGVSTHKTPVDSDIFSVRIATITILTITASKSSYMRTETLQFSFQPKYPDGSIASSGVALLTLTRPDDANQTLLASYDSVSQTFGISYKTFADNQTGAWAATLTGHGFTDRYGNSGPGTTLSSSTQLNPATLIVTVTTNNTSFTVGQPIKFNATASYPDGTNLQPPAVIGAYLVYTSQQQTINDTIALVYDTGFGAWVGTYTPKATDVGGLWSLGVKASDSQNPADSGLATRAITIQNTSISPSSDTSIPLYYYGIIVALISGLLILGFLAFRRRKTQHARLKIDIEAVRSEAGKIEGQEFFQSVKDQLQQKKKDEP